MKKEKKKVPCNRTGSIEQLVKEERGSKITMKNFIYNKVTKGKKAKVQEVQEHTSISGVDFATP